MKRETKLILGAGIMLLLTLPFIATTIVNASEQATNNTSAGKLNAIVGWLRGLGQRLGRFGNVEVSEEFKNRTVTIAKNDPDVQELLADGYTIIGVRPVIKSIVSANGDVTSKATKAIVIMKNETTKSFATVWVDLNTQSVTKIVTLTRTVINKS